MKNACHLSFSEDRSVDQANSSIFPLNCLSQGFLHCNRQTLLLKNFICALAHFTVYCLSFRLESIIYFSCVFKWLLRSKEATLTKSLLKSSNKSAPKFKFLLSNRHAILNY